MTIFGAKSQTRTRWVWLAALAASLITLGSALAQDSQFSLETPAGLVEINRGAGHPCGGESYEFQCDILSAQSRPLVTDNSVTVATVLPSKEHPLLLGIETPTGGNACCWESYLLDVSGPTLRFIKGYSLSDKAGVVGQDVVFNMVKGKDQLGDDLAISFRYRIGSGKKPVKISSGVRQAVKQPDGSESASDVMNDPSLREPLVRLVGPGYFATFRRYFDVSDPVSKVAGQYLVGDGFTAHFAPNSGIFVVDLKSKLAWAVLVKGDDPGQPTRRWGILTQRDGIPRKRISDWLSSKNIPVYRVTDMPLPDQMVRTYLNRREDVPLYSSAPSSVTVAKPPAGRTEGPVDAPLERTSGIFTVPVTINDAIKLNFVVDSGAADVSIPADVVMTLMRTGTIESTDFLGEQTYQLADGSRVPSKTFRIRSLKVGDKTLENVVGSVASVNGSLLLGQSFLNRFKSWSIDNEKHVLVLK